MSFSANSRIQVQVNENRYVIHFLKYNVNHLSWTVLGNAIWYLQSLSRTVNLNIIYLMVFSNPKGIETDGLWSQCLLFQCLSRVFCMVATNFLSVVVTLPRWFRQIFIDQLDWLYQAVLWRENPSEPIWCITKQPLLTDFCLDSYKNLTHVKAYLINRHKSH